MYKQNFFFWQIDNSGNVRYRKYLPNIKKQAIIFRKINILGNVRYRSQADTFKKHKYVGTVHI